MFLIHAVLILFAFKGFLSNAQFATSFAVSSSSSSSSSSASASAGLPGFGFASNFGVGVPPGLAQVFGIGQQQGFNQNNGRGRPKPGNNKNGNKFQQQQQQFRPPGQNKRPQHQFQQFPQMQFNTGFPNQRPQQQQFYNQYLNNNNFNSPNYFDCNNLPYNCEQQPQQQQQSFNPGFNQGFNQGNFNNQNPNFNTFPPAGNAGMQGNVLRPVPNNGNSNPITPSIPFSPPTRPPTNGNNGNSNPITPSIPFKPPTRPPTTATSKPFVSEGAHDAIIYPSSPLYVHTGIEEPIEQDPTKRIDPRR